MISRKSILIKDVTPKGIVVAVFATMNVIDKDGDLTLPGFFGKQDVVMLPAHDWKSVPLGKGVISEVGDKAIAELRMNLDIQSSKDWHSALIFDMEHGRPLQEYSYGFTLFSGGSSEGGEVNGQKAQRSLHACEDGTPGCRAHEVSPVVVGAGEMTGTIVAKGVETPEAPKDKTFLEQTESALIAAEGLIVRASSLADLRGKDGRALSTANQEKLAQLRARLQAADAALVALATTDDARKAWRVELGRALRAGA